jgi:hypothetical protein
LVLPSSADAAPPPGVEPSLGAKPVVLSRELSFGAGGDLFVRNIRWTSLSPTNGSATGLAYTNDCTPNCADGHYSTERVTLSFFKVTQAAQPYFNCVRVSSPQNTFVYTISERRYDYCPGTS